MISTLYYELAGERTQFNGIASAAGGILLWGDVKNANGRWEPIGESTAEQNGDGVAETGLTH